jgi:hypothetical protein
MKKLGLVLAFAGLASSAIYAGTRAFNTSKNKLKNVKAVKQPVGSQKTEGPVQSSISKSYTYVAEDF